MNEQERTEEERARLCAKAILDALEKYRFELDYDEHEKNHYLHGESGFDYDLEPQDLPPELEAEVLRRLAELDKIILYTSWDGRERLLEKQSFIGYASTVRANMVELKVSKQHVTEGRDGMMIVGRDHDAELQ